MYQAIADALRLLRLQGGLHSIVGVQTNNMKIASLVDKIGRVKMSKTTLDR